MTYMTYMDAIGVWKFVHFKTWNVLAHLWGILCESNNPTVPDHNESPKPRNFIHLIHFQSTHIEMKDQQSYQYKKPVKHFQANCRTPTLGTVFWNETCLRSTCSFLLCSPIHLRPPRRDPISSPKLRLVEHGTQRNLPSRELTYPTLGKGKSSSKCHFRGIC